MTVEGGIYVFCIIEESLPTDFGTVLMNGEEADVFTIHHNKAAMVVANMNGDPIPERQNLHAHQKVIMKVMEKYTVIPMSFGNVFNSKEDVELILDHLYRELNTLFVHLENKIEVGLKILAKQEWIDKSIDQDPLLQSWKAGNIDASDPALFYEKIQMGERVQKMMSYLEQKAEHEIYEPLAQIAQAGKINSLIPGKTILNASFLVDRTNEAVFDHKVNELYEIWKDRADFRYTGPWPAYNFVNIRLRIEK